MNKLLEVNRELNKYDNPMSKKREENVQRIMVSYGLDRISACQALERIEYKAAEVTFGTTFGLLAAYYARPGATLFKAQGAFQRKAWMPLPIYLTAFITGYHVSLQFPARIFPKIFERKEYAKNTMNFSEYSTENDLVSKFSHFDNLGSSSSKKDLLDYLTENHQGPMTKSDLQEYARNQTNGIPRNMQIKRVGRDKDDMYWYLGKIHGIENIVNVSDEELRNHNGDPLALQDLVNKATPTANFFESHEAMNNAFLENLRKYKELISSMKLSPSDKKKLLAMPFGNAKRIQHPEPQKGQIEWQIFEEYAGKPWDAFDDVTFDPEEKITEFEYEKFIPKLVLDTMDVNSQEFKNYIKMKNFTTKTEMEQHKIDQEYFKPIMGLMAGLSDQEKIDLMHHIQNKPRNWRNLESQVGKELERELAKVQEEEAYIAKNRFRLDNETINYADKSRMPVNQETLKFALKRREDFYRTIVSEVANIEDDIHMTDLQKKKNMLSIVLDKANESNAEFFNDLGLKPKEMSYFSIGDTLNRIDDQLESNDDWNLMNYINGIFTELDMSDYMDVRVEGIDNYGRGTETTIHLSQMSPEFLDMHTEPVNNAVQEFEELDERPNFSRSGAHQSYLEDKALEALEAEAAAEEEEEDDDDDEEGGDEEAEGEDDEDYGDEYGEEDPDARPWDTNIYQPKGEKPLLTANQNLRDKYNEVEIEAFMKLMNIRPTRDWKDNTDTLYWMEAREYEDDHQELDPYFHILGEVQRKDAEEIQTRKWREGAEVKFELNEKRPIRREFRF